MNAEPLNIENIPEENREAAIRFGRAMKRLHRMISTSLLRGMQADLSALELSFSQMAALHELRAGQPMTVTQLAERTSLSMPATSHLVERLVQRGLAARTENPENRREKVVELTSLGLDIVDGMDARFVRAWVETFANLSLEALNGASANMDLLMAQLDSTTPETIPPAKEKA